MHSPKSVIMNREIKNPLRVAILVRQFPNIVQTYILNHIVSLRNSGADTMIIAESNPKQLETHPAVKEYNLLGDTMYLSSDRASILKQIFTVPLYKLRYLTVIKRIIFSGLWKRYGLKYGIKAALSAKLLYAREFDIIHSHTLYSSYEYLYLKDVFNIPFVTTFHGLEPQSSKSLATKKIRFVLERTDVFIVNTRFARKQLTDMGCNQDKIHIIPQGTNTTDFPFKARTISKNKPVNILSVGRLSIEKGFHIAVNGIARLVEHYPNIRYHIIGSGPEEQHLTKLIHSIGLQDTVQIYGSVSTDELALHYSNAHIFILPSIDFHDGSHTETQGVVLQEAQSSGIPVIASRTGGIPEVIREDITGLLFEEKNDEQLSQKLESLLRDEQLYLTLSQQARKDVEDNYSIEVIGNKLLDVYKIVLCNH